MSFFKLKNVYYYLRDYNGGEKNTIRDLELCSKFYS